VALAGMGVEDEAVAVVAQQYLQAQAMVLLEPLTQAVAVAGVVLMVLVLNRTEPTAVQA
jgi:hypothetical protein